MSANHSDLALALRNIAERFGVGWHQGTEIEIEDIRNLSDAADALEEADKSYPSSDFCGMKL